MHLFLFQPSFFKHLKTAVKKGTLSVIMALHNAFKKILYNRRCASIIAFLRETRCRHSQRFFTTVHFRRLKMKKSFKTLESFESGNKMRKFGKCVKHCLHIQQHFLQTAKRVNENLMRLLLLFRYFFCPIAFVLKGTLRQINCD